MQVYFLLHAVLILFLSSFFRFEVNCRQVADLFFLRISLISGVAGDGLHAPYQLCSQDSCLRGSLPPHKARDRFYLS